MSIYSKILKTKTTIDSDMISEKYFQVFQAKIILLNLELNQV